VQVVNQQLLDQDLKLERRSKTTWLKVYAIGYGENEVNTANQAKVKGQFQMANQLETAGLNNLEDPYDHAMVEGTLPVFNSWAIILFDTGATHSFISTSFASILGLVSEFFKRPLLIKSLICDVVKVDKISRSCLVEILGRRLFFDLMIMDLLEYDVILGIDWLSHYNAMFDCAKKMVTIRTNKGKTKFICIKY
jgi:hypothetical protein